MTCLANENDTMNEPDVFAVNEHEEAEADHVPGSLVVVPHRVESEGHVRVTVIATQVVLK